MTRDDPIRDLLNKLEFLIDEALEGFEGGESGHAHQAIQKAKQVMLERWGATENLSTLEINLVRPQIINPRSVLAKAIGGP